MLFDTAYNVLDVSGPDGRASWRGRSKSLKTSLRLVFVFANFVADNTAYDSAADDAYRAAFKNRTCNRAANCTGRGILTLGHSGATAYGKQHRSAKRRDGHSVQCCHGHTLPSKLVNRSTSITVGMRFHSARTNRWRGILTGLSAKAVRNFPG
jgi:hypothetical protein